MRSPPISRMLPRHVQYNMTHSTWVVRSALARSERKYNQSTPATTFCDTFAPVVSSLRSRASNSSVRSPNPSTRVSCKSEIELDVEQVIRSGPVRLFPVIQRQLFNHLAHRQVNTNQKHVFSTTFVHLYHRFQQTTSQSPSCSVFPQILLEIGLGHFVTRPAYRSAGHCRYYSRSPASHEPTPTVLLLDYSCRTHQTTHPSNVLLLAQSSCLQ